jgi:hypothetical protein
VVTAEVGLLGAVDLGQSNVLLLEGCGGLLVLGCKGLAVSAPRGEDCAMLSDMCAGDILVREVMLTLCEDEVILLDETLEGVCLKVDNVGSGGQGGCAEQT